MDQLTFEQLDHKLSSSNGKIIHQIWFNNITKTKKEADKNFKALTNFRKSWQEKNPTWTYKCWNAKDCINLLKTYFPEHLEMYRSYPYPIQQCDCIRYCFLYRYGGLYADMDYFCNRPWNEVLKNYPNDFYITETPNKIYNEIHISNSLMYSIPKHPFWKHMLIEMEKYCRTPIYYSKHLTIMYTTGPAIINRIFHKHKTQYKLNYYPYELFHPFGINTDLRVNVDPKVYAYHLQKGYWNTIDTNILNFFYKEYKIILFIIFVLFTPILVQKFKLLKK